MYGTGTGIHTRGGKVGSSGHELPKWVWCWTGRTGGARDELRRREPASLTALVCADLRRTGTPGKELAAARQQQEGSDGSVEEGGWVGDGSGRDSRHEPLQKS